MRARLLALVVALASGLAGCGLGTGAGGGEARLLVTRDFGSVRLGARILQDPPGSETVIGMLARDFPTTARDGGGGSFYVNGVEAERGAAHLDVHPGDRIWWDRHDRSATRDVAAVVGSFPEPFVHGADGRRWPVVLECADDVSAACATVADRLAAAGARAVGRQALGTGVGKDTLRVIVGPWREIGDDAALELLQRGPAASGVYARFARGGGALELLDPRGAVARTLGAGAGLLAATRFEQQAPTWTITGTDAAGVAAAARALDERRLRARFALAVGAGGDEPVPALFHPPGR